MASASISHFAPLLLTIFHLLPLAGAADAAAALAAFPDLSDFAALLSSAAAPDLAPLSSLTLLAVPNSHLRPALASSSAAAADSVRQHVVLQYLSKSDLAAVPAGGLVVPTLAGAAGLNLTASGPIATFRSLASAANATVTAVVESVPDNLTILAVDALLVASTTAVADAGEYPPPPPPPPPLNITQILADGKDFNVLSAMLRASGAGEKFEGFEHGAGITIFAPTDAAFADLPDAKAFQALTAEKKRVVLEYHALHSYYPLGSLESIVNPVQPTVATEAATAGTYTLNITRVNGSVTIDSGIVQAAITQTVFDENPLAVFGLSKVLLPRELFGAVSLGGGPASAAMPPPEEVMAPEAAAPGPDGQSDSGKEASWGGGRGWRLWGAAAFSCVHLLVFV